MIRRLLLAVIFACFMVTGCQPRQPIEVTPTPAPQVIYISPNSGAEMPLDGEAVLTFDQPMSEDSVKIDVQPAVEYKLTWIDEASLKITPIGLERASQYKFTVNAASQSGQPLEEAASFKLNTIGSLVVTDVVPANGATGIATDSLISVFFNRPVVPLTLLENLDDLPQPLHFEPEIPGKGEWINTSIYVWRPSEPLAGGQTYTATVATLTAPDGALLHEPFSWQFATFPPQMVSGSPYDREPNVTPDHQITVRFNQPMDHASVEAAFSLLILGRTPSGDGTLDESNARSVMGSFKWNEASDEVVFDPASPLAFESSYRVKVGASAHASDGGAALPQDYTWTFTTVAYPRITGTNPMNGAVEVSPYTFVTSIYFSAPIDPETIEGKITIEPKPLKEPSIYVGFLSSQIEIATVLDANTRYTVHIAPGISDPYGHVIETPHEFYFTTGSYPPEMVLSLEQSLSILDSRETSDLLMFTRNLKSARYRIYELNPRDVFASSGTVPQTPSRDQLVRTQYINAEGEENIGYNWRIRLNDDQGDALPQGVYLLVARGTGIQQASRRIIVLANANVVTKHSETQAAAWVVDLQSGEPLPDVSVQFYDDTGEYLGTARTDADGFAQIVFDEPQTGIEQILAIADSGDTYGVTYSGWGTETYQPVNRYDQPFTLYAYTDRPIYRPGQPVYFKALLRNRDDATYSLPDATDVHVTITSPQGEIVYDKTLTTSEFGSLSDSFTLAPGAATGSYMMNFAVAWGDSSKHVNIWFQVAEYRAPNFQIDLTLPEPEVLEGDSISAEVEASYFFGGQVQMGWVKWQIFSQPNAFHADLPAGYYNFEDLARSDRLSASFGRPIASGEGPMEADGQFTFNIPTRLTEYPDSQRFTVQVVVMDAGGDWVTAEANLVVHKGEYYVGIRPQNYLNPISQPAPIEFAVVDWEGTPIAGQDVQVEVVELKTYNVQEESPDGETLWVSSTEEIPITSATVQTNDEGLAVFPFIPLEGGSYKVIAAVNDGSDGRTQSSSYVWVTGDTRYVPWVMHNSKALDLIVDKTDYEPGETAKIMIQSPFTGENVRALITVERSGILAHQVVELTSSSYVYELPITQEFAPDIYVTATLIKGADAITPQPDFRYGSIKLTVDTAAYALDVSVTPNVTEASPGSTVTYQIEVRDAQGKPVDAEVSLALVDLATLQLAPPNSRKMLPYFYSEIPLKVWTSLALMNLVEPLDDELLDQAKGGGGGSGDAFYDLRQDFRDTAYWNAAVRTGDDGIAEVTVTLPDNLTTWRMDARAITAQALVGEGTADIVSNMDVMIRPITPRFFVPLDAVTLGALAYNNTDQAIEAEVSMIGTGYDLTGDTHQSVTIPAGSAVKVEWPVSIQPDTEWVDLTFTLDAGDLGDSTKPPVGDPDHDRMLPVHRYVVPETVGTAGQLTEAGMRTETIYLPPELATADGSIDVKIDHTMAGTLIAGLAWLEDYPYLCTEQTVSRFLANAHTLRILRQLNLSKPEMEANLNDSINDALQRLYAQQHVDGGWGWFVSDYSSVLVTTYVVQGLITAQEAGYPVDNNALTTAIYYLQQQLADPAIDPNREAHLLWVLARAGSPDAGRASTLYERRTLLKNWSKALLAQALWRMDPNDPRLLDLKTDLVSSAVITAAGTHWVEDTPDYWNWNTDTRTTAIVLDTFVLLWPDTDLTTNAVRWLMSARTHDRWATTQETTWAILALGDWMHQTHELDPHYDWQVLLDGNRQMNGTTSAENVLESETYSIPISEAGMGSSQLSFTHGAGEGNLYYTAYLNAWLHVEEVDAISHGFVLTRRYLDADGRMADRGQVGDTLTVELTIIVPGAQEFVVIEDYLPAGAEAIDPNLDVNATYPTPTFTREDDINSWGWWWFSQIDIRDEKVVLQAEYLPAGTYLFTYQMRLNLAGEYHVIPTVAQNFYFPEVYGRTDGLLFAIEP